MTEVVKVYAELVEGDKPVHVANVEIVDGRVVKFDAIQITEAKWLGHFSSLAVQVEECVEIANLITEYGMRKPPSAEKLEAWFNNVSA